MQKKTLITIGIIVLVILAAVLVYIQSERSIEGRVIQTEEIVPQSEELPLVRDPTDIKEFVVTARQFEFLPETINVSQGNNVRVVLSTADVSHGFYISEYQINERIDPGEVKTITFIADKKGEFPIVCNVPCGSGHGSMRGTLIVN